MACADAPERNVVGQEEAHCALHLRVREAREHALDHGARDAPLDHVVHELTFQGEDLCQAPSYFVQQHQPIHLLQASQGPVSRLTDFTGRLHHRVEVVVSEFACLARRVLCTLAKDRPI